MASQRSSGPPSYEKIVSHHGLAKEHMEERITDEVLFQLARKMTRWRSIDLGLEKSVVDTVERDPNTQEEDKQKKLLERWKEAYGPEATYQRLATSFSDSRRADLADAVCIARKGMLPVPATDGGSEWNNTGTYIVSE